MTTSVSEVVHDDHSDRPVTLDDLEMIAGVFLNLVGCSRDELPRLVEEQLLAKGADVRVARFARVLAMCAQK